MTCRFRVEPKEVLPFCSVTMETRHSPPSYRPSWQAFGASIGRFFDTPLLPMRGVRPRGPGATASTRPFRSGTKAAAESHQAQANRPVRGDNGLSGRHGLCDGKAATSTTDTAGQRSPGHAAPQRCRCAEDLWRRLTVEHSPGKCDNESWDSNNREKVRSRTNENAQDRAVRDSGTRSPFQKNSTKWILTT